MEKPRLHFRHVCEVSLSLKSLYHEYYASQADVLENCCKIDFLSHRFYYYYQTDERFDRIIMDINID